MEVPELLDHLADDGTLMAAAAGRAGLAASVPGCPAWVVRDLVLHTGGIHRWATDAVARSLPAQDDGVWDTVGSGPGDDGLLDWFVEGHAALVATLRATSPALQAFTFLPGDPPQKFWVRRQAHETAVHRADAEAAGGGPVTAFAPAFARDGIAELLLGFGSRRRRCEPGTLRLEPTDAEPWLVTLRPDGLDAVAGDEWAVADATVRGTASDVYLWLWNRPAPVSIIGDPTVVASWRQVRVR